MYNWYIRKCTTEYISDVQLNKCNFMYNWLYKICTTEYKRVCTTYYIRLCTADYIRLCTTDDIILCTAKYTKLCTFLSFWKIMYNWIYAWWCRLCITEYKKYVQLII